MVCKPHGTPSPTRMSKTLLPTVLDTAMSPRPAEKRNKKQLFDKIKVYGHYSVYWRKLKGNDLHWSNSPWTDQSIRGRETISKHLPDFWKQRAKIVHSNYIFLVSCKAFRGCVVPMQHLRSMSKSCSRYSAATGNLKIMYWICDLYLMWM